MSDQRLDLFSADPSAKEINRLHAEAHAHAETAVKRAILCGQKLAAKKAELGHGGWLPWVEKHLTFSERTARDYMRVAANRQHVADLDTVREAVKLLAEPKDAPSEPPREFRNDPELERRATTAEREASDLRQALSNLDTQLKDARSRLSDLEKLKSEKAKVEKAVKDIAELERRKQELFKDSESLKVATDVLVRSRQFFTRECMQIPALVFRPGTVEAIRQDMAGLIELVENWTDAMRRKFTEDL